MKEHLTNYQRYLEDLELSDNTIKMYMRSAKEFVNYAREAPITKKMVIQYRRNLENRNYKIATINLSIIEVNKFLHYCGYDHCRIKVTRQQRRQSLEHVISRQDYKKLLEYALETHREKYYLIMKTLAMTGIRISELRYITVESLERGMTQVFNKGKVREIYIPDPLIEGLRQYCATENLQEGSIFRGNRDTPISRVAVWKMMKHMADMVGIDPRKVYPHSFRHFFALTYMNRYANIFELADILGHSSIEITRIYSTSTVEQKRKRMGELDD